MSFSLIFLARISLITSSMTFNSHGDITTVEYLVKEVVNGKSRVRE
ncbi:MAG: hypothetical protein ABH821_05755 [archaeon]